MEDKKKIKGEVVKRRFKIDEDFVDPLLYGNIESFDDFEVEEIPSYYKIHLGCNVINHEERIEDYGK
jgi:hypothetical protein